MRRLLLAAFLATACGPNNPTPVPIVKTEPAKTEPAKAEPTKAAETKIAAPTKTDPATPKAPEPPLTQEELDLIAADPATLTPEKRRERAFALRRKCLQNPEGACAKQLEEIRTAVESGTLVPQLPEAKKGEMTLSAPTKAEPGAGEAAKAESGKTGAAGSGKTAPAPAGKSP
jgi:hypothetical protein